MNCKSSFSVFWVAVLAGSLAASFALVACGNSDSSFAAVDGGNSFSVESSPVDHEPVRRHRRHIRRQDRQRRVLRRE